MPQFSHRLLPALVLALGLFCPRSPARADSLEGAAKFASGSGNLAFLGSGLLLPFLEDGGRGTQNALRTADATLTATVFTEALKHLVREKRPDGSARTSFPSGHATAAFAVATMQSEFHPRQAPYWYLGAALIGASRVKLHRHYWHDVVAGAAVGYFTSRLELRRSHGLLLFPFIDKRQNTPNSAPALSFSRLF